MLNESERARNLDRAKKVAALEQSEGWREFVALAHQLMTTNMPQASKFTNEKATEIASQLVFINGIKACLNLMEQQKSILKGTSHDL